MFTETKILEGEEKFIRINYNNAFKVGARCNQVVQYDNLATRQIKAWLNGHLIIDTGLVNKEDRLEYEFDEISVNNINLKKGDKIDCLYSRSRMEGILIGFANDGSLYVEVGSFTYNILRSKVIGVNGLLVGRLDQQ